jgi:F0F1-type ATP synthase membrane subunit b/b'
MSHYNDLLIRTLLALAVVWVFASIIFNERIDDIKTKHRATIHDQLQEIRRLRQQNTELSFELSKLKNKK